MTGRPALTAGNAGQCVVDASAVIGPGTLVLYHGSLAGHHGGYVVVRQCPCRSCWPVAVISGGQVVIPHTADRYVLSYPDMPGYADLSHVRRDHLTPMSPGLAVHVAAGADRDRTRPYGLRLTKIHPHQPGTDWLHVHGEILRLDGTRTGRSRAAVLIPSRLAPITPRNGREIHDH